MLCVGYGVFHRFGGLTGFWGFVAGGGEQTTATAMSGRCALGLRSGLRQSGGRFAAGFRREAEEGDEKVPLCERP